MENIVDAIKVLRKNCREAATSATALAIVNMAVLRRDAENTFRTLKHK